MSVLVLPTAACSPYHGSTGHRVHCICKCDRALAQWVHSMAPAAAAPRSVLHQRQAITRPAAYGPPLSGTGADLCSTGLPTQCCSRTLALPPRKPFPCWNILCTTYHRMTASHWRRLQCLTPAIYPPAGHSTTGTTPN